MRCALAVLQAPHEDVVDAVQKRDPSAVADKLDKGYQSESRPLPAHAMQAQHICLQH